MTDMVFVHGGAQGSWVWAETISALKSQSQGTVNALALDVPGCGTKRGRDTSALGIDDVARELAGEIVAAGMTGIVLVGHSQAGCVIPRIAELVPDRVRKIVLVSCSAPLAGQSIMAMMGGAMHGVVPGEVGWPLDPATTAQAELFAAMFCNDMTPEQAASFMATLGADAWPASAGAETGWRYEHLGAFAPTYVVCRRDGILPVEWQEEFARRFQAARIAEIDAGHQAMNTRPQGLAEILIAEA